MGTSPESQDTGMGSSGFVRYGSSFLLFTLAYAALALLSLRIATLHASASPFWPASGLALVGIIRAWPGARPGIFLGAVIANALSHAPIFAAFGIGCGNLLEGLLAAAVYKKIMRYDADSFILRPAFATLAGASLGAFISASLGLCALGLTQAIPWNAVLPTFSTWWGGDVVGMLLLVPVLTAESKKTGMRLLSLLWRLTLIVMLLALCCFISFSSWGGGAIFLLFLPLLLSASLLGSRWIALTTLVTAFSAVTLAVSGRGPFGDLRLNDNLSGFQLLLSALALSGLITQGFIQQVAKRQILPILALGWTLSGLLFFEFHQHYAEQDQRNFNRMVADADQKITQSLINYEHALSGLAGFVASSGNPSIQQWSNYVAASKLFSSFPGMDSVSLIIPVDSRSLADKADFRVPSLAVTDRAERFILQCIEPLQTQRDLLGQDVGSDPQIRSILEDSRRLRQPLMAPPITPALLLYMPIIPAGPDSQVTGWVAGTFVMSRMLDSDFSQAARELDFSIYDVTDPSSRPVLFSTAKAALKAEEKRLIKFGGRTFETVFQSSAHFQRSKDLAFAWVGSFGALLTLALGHVITTSSIFRRRAEEEIARQLQSAAARDRLWRTLTECSPVGIFQISADGQPTYSNKLWQQLTGVDSVHATIEDRWNRLHPEDRERLIPIWQSTLASGRMMREEFRLIGADNKITWVKVHTAPIFGENQHIEGHVGIAVDINERKMRELDIEKSRVRAIQSSKMATLGEMASGIAHEINNPLAVINAISCHLRYRSDQIPPDLVQDIIRIEEMSERIAKIIRGLRAFSRNADKDPIRPVALDSIVAGTLALCGTRFEAAGVALQIHPLPTIHVGCRGGQLAQVFLNLLSNALDAASPSAKPWVSVEGEIVDSFVRIRIKDSGPGIPPAIIDRIMEPFFTTKDVDKGTGLGLSIAKGIIEDHGGRLFVDIDSPTTCFVLEVRILNPQLASA